jgi:predicted RecB family nuclease
MLIPDNFIFNQQNLQAYSDCKRRFYLEEVLRLPWLASESEPALELEKLIELGSQFHLLCQQYFSGVPKADLVQTIEDPVKQFWWGNFEKLCFDPSVPVIQSEKYLLVPIGNHRLAAKIDLLVSTDNKSFMIYDWKTSKNLPKFDYLAKRMQTKVYPLVLYTFLRTLNKHIAISPEDIQMIYWYPEFPDFALKFPYTQTRYEAESKELFTLIQDILEGKEEWFVMTSDLKHCNYCRYQSYCNREKPSQFRPVPIDEILLENHPDHDGID